MSTLDWARWQFAITTLFHFIFVPMSIGLALFVAICQTRYYRRGDEVYLRMTRFWGKFMLISMAIGVVTGIVQEFQFGMNWSQYSRYVGDVFGAPLAMEGLIAFFLESTFLGLWIFGWGRLSPKLHLATIWLVSVGTMLSAYFILAANSWMQHPVGVAIDHATHRAELKNIFAVLTNSTVLLAFPHTILGAFTTGGMLVVAVCGYLLLRRRPSDVVTRSLRIALPLTLVAVLATMAFGDGQGRLMEKQQPMKMAAAEALYNTQSGAPFSILATGRFTRHPSTLNKIINIPHGLSLLATLSWGGKVEGVNNINRAEQRKYGPGDYVPIVGVTYWTFRLMIGAGILMLLLALAGLVLVRRGRIEHSRWFQRAALAGVVLPILANWTGWIFTEVGRQPWVVFGLLKTNQANSPNVSSADIVITLAGYIVIYGALIAIGGWLMWREVRHGPEAPARPGAPAGDSDSHPELALAY
ncbi:MAG TPA: cytochrome ubiquinol oxidase subunit I [Solirubrobacteraceae bacterium]|nr:cytochrome ubiquinol oxidase subunit I [Solirubrobacteraceae bacterium]